jgi:hypothetical protein
MQLANKCMLALLNMIVSNMFNNGIDELTDKDKFIECFRKTLFLHIHHETHKSKLY